MAKSEVLIEMPEFEKKYNLAMVDAEKVSSRVRPKKSFRLFYKNAYDQDRLEHPIFGTTEPITFKNLVLRAVMMMTYKCLRAH